MTLRSSSKDASRIRQRKAVRPERSIPVRPLHQKRPRILKVVPGCERKCGDLRGGDRGFESVSLQRGVRCELRSSQARPASRANLTSLDYDLSYISILPPHPDLGRDHRLGSLKGAVLSAVQRADGSTSTQKPRGAEVG